MKSIFSDSQYLIAKYHGCVNLCGNGFISLAPATPFKAFDCSKTDDSIKSYWLNDVNQCGNFEGFYKPPVKESIQVIKKLNTIDVVVYECKIKVSTYSQYCG